MKLGSIEFLRSIAVILIVYANAIIATNAFGKSNQKAFIVFLQIPSLHYLAIIIQTTLGIICYRVSRLVSENAG